MEKRNKQWQMKKRKSGNAKLSIRHEEEANVKNEPKPLIGSV
jgi:hypothetical protein